MTCADVDERDLDTRYLAGSLDGAETEAFESHFFACERCWGLVQSGLEIQAAEGGVGAVQPSRPSLRRRTLPRSTWWGLAAAAALLLVAGTLRWLGPTGIRDNSDAFRSGAAAFAVTSGAIGTAATAAWPRVPEADVYQVRLYAADGSLLIGREMADTFTVVPADSLKLLQPGGAAYWEVQAFDRLRNLLARSGLVRARVPDSPP